MKKRHLTSLLQDLYSQFDRARKKAGLVALVGLIGVSSSSCIEKSLGREGLSGKYFISSYDILINELVNVKDFGAVGDGITDDSAAIQAAFGSIRNAGGVLFIPFGTYVCSSPLDFCQTHPSNDTYRYTILGNQARLDFSSSGIESGNLVSIGADSLEHTSQYGDYIFQGIQIIGPHKGGRPTEKGLPETSVVGLNIKYALQVTVRDCQIRRCCKGIYTNYSFPLHAENLNIYQNTLGVHVGDDSTLALWENVNFVENRFGLLLQPNTNTKCVYGQTFIKPRFEGNLVGCVVDPLDFDGRGQIGVESCDFYSPYIENNRNEVFRIGRSVDLTDVSVRGKDRDRYVHGICIQGGHWSSGNGWKQGHEPVLFPSSKTERPVTGVILQGMPFEYSSLGNPGNVECMTFYGIRDPYISLKNSRGGYVNQSP